MRRATLLAVVLLALGFPALAMSSHASFEQLLEDLETLRAEHTVPGFALTVVSDRHGLQTGPGLDQSLRQGFRWYGHSGDGDGYLSRFRREGQPLATIAIAAQDGELYLQADFGNYQRAGELP